MPNTKRARRLLESAANRFQKLLILFMPREKRSEYQDKIRKNIFERVFLEKRWGADHFSGGGSTVEYTKVTVDIIRRVVEQYEIKSMLDVPCGDFVWMPEFLKSVAHPLEYIGGDIAPSLIDHNRASHPGYNFQVIDLVKDQLPVTDLIFCRDALQHLPISDIKLALANISNSGAKYLLTTTHMRRTGWRNARDIRLGRCADRNLLLKPFNLADPLVIFSEQDASHKFLGLWKLPLEFADR